MVVLAGHIFTSIALGLSTSYEFAFVFRSINGLFSANAPILKSLIREESTDANIAKLYVYFGLGIGMSNILGPLIASLSNPAKTFGGFFNTEFFIQYPYIIPFSI